MATISACPQPSRARAPFLFHLLRATSRLLEAEAGVGGGERFLPTLGGLAHLPASLASMLDPPWDFCFSFGKQPDEILVLILP